MNSATTHLRAQGMAIPPHAQSLMEEVATHGLRGHPLGRHVKRQNVIGLNFFLFFVEFFLPPDCLLRLLLNLLFRSFDFGAASLKEAIGSVTHLVLALASRSEQFIPPLNRKGRASGH